MDITPINRWPKEFRRVAFWFVLVLTVGMLSGVAMIGISSGTSPSEITEHYRGSDVADDFDIPEKYPPSLHQMLVLFHSHVTMFAFIYAATALLFCCTSILTGGFKVFLITEPFISIIITFGSLMGLRFGNELFLWLMIFSSSLMYISYFVMAGVILFELFRARKFG